MEKQRLRAVVLSGLSYAGKSHYLRLLEDQGIFTDYARVSADYFRDKVLGDRPATLAEQRVFREAVWFEIKRNLVIERKSTLLEMVLKTQANHFRPLTLAVQDANRHLGDYSDEHVRAGKTVPNFQVQLKVVTLFSDLKSLKRRIQHRQEQIRQMGNITGTNIFDLRSFIEKSGVNVFEVPALDQSFFLDTSDESPETVDKNITEIVGYVCTDAITSDQDARRKLAEAYLKELKAVAEY